MKKLATEIILAILVLVALVNVTYRVDETETAVLLKMGKVVREITDPGLYFKLPWPFRSVTILDKRYINWDSELREIITDDKKTLLIDTFAYFKIIDGIKYIKNMQTRVNAQTRVDETVYSEMRNQLGATVFDSVVIHKRVAIMDQVLAYCDSSLEQYSLTSIIVRKNRVDLPPENKRLVFDRMEAERKRQTNLYRSQGEEEALAIESDADRQAKVIRSAAVKEAEEIKGTADARATAIYNGAYGSDLDFYRLWKGL